MKRVTPGFLKRRLGASVDWSRAMKNFYRGIAVALVLTVLAVAFVPGVDDLVERVFQQYVGRAAR